MTKIVRTLHMHKCYCFRKLVSNIGLSNIYYLGENDNLFLISVWQWWSR
jgi:hypothetical protein